MSFAEGNTSEGSMASVNHNLQSVCAHLTDTVQSILNDYFIGGQCSLAAQYHTDTIVLVIETSDHRKFMHPAFITRAEIDDRTIDEDLLRWRIATTLQGRPARYPNEVPAGFTLDEINAAQDEIDKA